MRRDERYSTPVGLTIINWWSRFSHGELPDSLHQIESYLKPLASRLAA